MAKKTRSALKARYMTGTKPLQTDFADWIDSFVHVDEAAGGNAGGTTTLYVQKMYANSAGCTVAADGSISSTNASYTAQLTDAANKKAPFPDPWSARNYAKNLISTGAATAVRIVIQPGQYYVIGSSILTSNGDKTGNPAVNETPEFGVANGSQSGINLFVDGVYYHFAEGSGIHNVCKSYEIPLMNSTLADYKADYTTVLKSGVSGVGKFVWTYGESDGFICRFLVVFNPAVELSFQARELKVNMARTIDATAYRRLVFDVDDYIEYNNMIVVTQMFDYEAYSKAKPEALIKVNNYLGNRYKIEGLSAPASDDWTSIVWAGFKGAMVKININNWERTSTYAGVPTTGLLSATARIVDALPVSLNRNLDIIANFGNVNISRGCGYGLFRLFEYSANVVNAENCNAAITMDKVVLNGSAMFGGKMICGPCNNVHTNIKVKTLINKGDSTAISFWTVKWGALVNWSFVLEANTVLNIPSVAMPAIASYGGSLLSGEGGVELRNTTIVQRTDNYGIYLEDDKHLSLHDVTVIMPTGSTKESIYSTIPVEILSSSFMSNKDIHSNVTMIGNKFIHANVASYK